MEADRESDFEADLEAVSRDARGAGSGPRGTALSPALRAGWSALDARAGSPMEQSIWAEAGYEAFSEDEPRLFAVGPADAPEAIAPLVSVQVGTPHLGFVGAGQLGEPMDLLVRDEAAREALCEALAASGASLWLGRVPVESPTRAALARAYRWPGGLVTRPALEHTTIALDPSWCEPDRHLTARRRSDLRRAQRRAESLGPVRAEIRAPRPDELGPLLEAAIAVESSGWKGRLGTAIAIDAVCGRFFRRYAERASARGLLRLGLLWIGDEPAAMQLAMEWRHRYWLLKIGFDERFAPCSPGMLLMAESVRWCAERGLSSYELLGRPEPWTLVWTKKTRDYVSLRAYPRTMRGISRLAVDGTRFVLRRVVAGAARVGASRGGAS
jgi:CelD/BcsL family acetyltransferase involved in cellulose biosynthesis